MYLDESAGSGDRVTVPWVKNQKGKQKITMLTAYDYPTACYLDEAGVDVLLVGDSLGTVLYGEPDTLSVTMEDMLRHTRAVVRGAKRSLVIGDMPFMSYQESPAEALKNAARFLKEARAHGVKVEGGVEIAETIRAMTRAGIPVVAHIGLTPQSIHSMGNYRMFGKTESESHYLLKSAQSVAEAGAFCLVLECVQTDLAKKITDRVAIPTIGIGSGESCDGQVLVTHDLVGLTYGRIPRFVKPLVYLRDPFQAAARSFVGRVKGHFRESSSSLPKVGLTHQTPVAPVAVESESLQEKNAD